MVGFVFTDNAYDNEDSGIHYYSSQTKNII